MAINFNALSTNKGFSVPEAGTYYATIESAEMKQPKDTSKPMYLNLKLKLKNAEGKPAGTIFDILTEGEHSLVQFKLRRFLEAINIVFDGEFELKDLAKLCVGKELIVDTKVEKGTNGNQDRASVDVMKDIYYSMSEAAAIFGEAAPSVINASDAEDASAVVEDDF
jgi:hypothetical protein